MNFRKSILNWPRRVKQVMVLGVDATLLWLTCVLALSVRLEKLVLMGPAMGWMLGVGLALVLPLFIMTGMYRAIFRYTGLQVMFTLNKVLAFYCACYALLFTVVSVPGVPRSLGLLQPMLFAFAVISSRLLVRHWLGNGSASLRRGLPRVLIYGAGSAGRQLATGLAQSHEVVVLGYVDDDERLHGHVLNGLTIFSPAQLKRVVGRQNVQQIYLAMPSLSRRRRNEIIESLLHLKVQVRTLPGLMALADGKVEVSDLKELDIEDLLGREPVPPNPLMMAKKIQGKVVMVTGAGGSIGSELCRQIVKAGPSVLVLVELTEFALYAIEQELTRQVLEESPTDVQLVPLLANVRDAERMDEILRTWKPHTVYHAAAYKHVPLVEHNPAEGIKNNVLGTLNTARLSALHGVRDFVLISTDKAVRPTNVMGGSKRLAEMVLQALAAEQAAQPGPLQVVQDKPMAMLSRQVAPRSVLAATTFSMVRFGNVLGSSGSVVPLFRQQIKDGGPITLTDERITRYFMTIPEAAQLVIQAGAMASGGDVFVLDMGEPVRIIDLARRMVELSGLSVKDEANPQGDIEIAVTGLRPGEKLYEELLIGDNPLPTHHARIMKAHEEFLPWATLQAKLDQLNEALDVNNVPRIRNLLKEVVPGYQPDGEVVDWVWMENAKAG